MIRLRPSGVDELLIKRVRDWYEPGPGVFFTGIAGTASFSPAMLFTAGVNGAWYDPSDLTTLFQDAAGTTPVTAMEQPVGRMLDKSGRGNHAFNNSGNSANFPVLSARYNLLTKTEQFDDAYWYKTPATATVPVTNATSPIGTSTACKFAEGTTTAFHSVSFTAAASPATSVSTKYKFSVYVKPAGRTWIALELNNPNVTGYTTYFNLSGSGSIGQNPGANTDISIVEFPVGSGWYLCSISRTTLSNQTQIQPSILPKLADGGGAYTGDGTSGIYIWGADLRVANDAPNQPAYQRVNTASDYDTVGFKQAEVFDGINDYLLASAGGGSTTAFFWCSAIRVGKVGAAQTLFSDAGANTGYVVRINASNQLELSAGNGTAYTTIATTATLAVGQRVVLTAWHDGTNLNVQINNGTVQQTAFVTATAGTAQFTIGKGNNAATNFFSGRLYEKVYTKDSVPSAAQIASTKSYVANIAGITL